MKPPATAKPKPRQVKRARIERGVLVFVALVSLAWSGWWWGQILQAPAAALVVDRAASGLTAAYEQALSREATPEALAARISARLDEVPRDWVVIEALTDLAAELGIALPPALLERIAVLEDWVQGELRPDLTLLLNVPVATGLMRAGRRGVADRFEREDVIFFERVRAIYLERAAREPDRCRVVDASQSVEAVRAEVETMLAKWLESG